ncbi:MAG: tRNA (adenosine(37)-N6)-dimethylallyltransferase MiaA [Rhodobacteraceae bacterium]|nr:tRNA (adenosine(37)-N6)-dimethylallyltransferase MiaA [Paracoccaceae bacterium]
MMKRILCIAGPTASGKSAHAVKLAKKHDGEIINADALQVYGELHVLSARPSIDEMGDIPHHMFGHIDPSVRYSTGKWLVEADALIIEILARGKTPILVGGTGLYFKALTEGLARIPDPEPESVRAAQTILDTNGIERLRAEAEHLDPLATLKVLGHDPQRLLRIVSVALGTPNPLSVWQRNTRAILPKGTWEGAVLLPKRENLYDKINARFEDMVRNGGLEEARRIRALSLAPDLPAMKAIGLRELIAHLDGELSLDGAIELAMRETRRFAKRQYTWLRGQMQGWEQIEVLND